MKKTKRYMSLLLAVMLLAALTGCGETAEQEEKFILGVCVCDQIGSLDPAMNTDSDAQSVFYALYENLMRYTDDGTGTAVLSSGMAKEYTEVSNYDGTIRVYGENIDAEVMMESACAEVQQETALGAYLLDYVTYTCAAEHDYYALSFHFGYRRTQAEQAGIINATSTEALPELLRSAAAQGAERLTVRVGYFTSDPASVKTMVQEVQSEFPDTLAMPWQVQFYPNTEDAGIVEIFFTEQ